MSAQVHSFRHHRLIPLRQRLLHVPRHAGASVIFKLSLRKLIAIILFILLWSCSDGGDPRLARISGIVSDTPEEALAALDSISYGSLPEADRHFYDFLYVKASDKAYVAHQSDSLILDVVDYYEGSGLYAEALYYAGRVYSDMGDYPSALEYFQKSYDNISGESAEAVDLLGRVLSQTSRLLNRLRLYDRAIPYLQEALKVDSILNDTFSLAYDNELLGAVYRHKRYIPEATECFVRASRWARFLTGSDTANMRAQLAITKLYGGDVDSALILMQGMPDKVRPVQRNKAMIYASDIYLAAGILDTAYLYADMLVHTSDENNRKSGYRNLFSPELFGLIPPDSIPVFIRAYHEDIDRHYNGHDAQRVLMQDAFYNYRQHVKERERAEVRSRHFVYAVAILMVMVLAGGIIILYLRYRRKNLQVRYYETIHELADLRKAMAEAKSSGGAVAVPSLPASGPEALRSRLLEQIDLIKMEQGAGNVPVDTAILDSEVMKSIGEYIEGDKAIPDSSPVWGAIERTVHSVSPRFKEHLQLLARQKLKEQDYRVALLIRCGITPTQTTILLGRTKGTISYRRRHLCEMLMGENADTQLVDNIIRCL